MEHTLYLEELYKITEKMGTSLEIEELLELIMEGSIKVSGANEGSLMLLDEETQTLRIMVAKGLSQKTKEFTIIKLGTPIAGIVAKEGKPLLLTDELKDTKFSNIHHEGRRIKSAMSLPLKIKNRTIGVLNLNITKGENLFQQEDIQPLSIFATQAAIAIENTKLYQTTMQRTEELIILNRAGKILSKTFQEEEILNTMINTIQQIIEFDVAGFLLLNNKNKNILTIISFKKQRDEIIDVIKNKLLHLISELNSPNFEKEKIMIKVNIRKGEGALKEGCEQQELQSHLVFPLIAKEEVIGAVSVHSFKSHFFKESHLHTLSILAPQVAIAIENARIYEEMQNLYTETIKALAAEIETRNPYTMGHSERVTEYSIMIAKALNLAPSQVELIKYAGLLHDLGKIGISDSILLKPGKLTDEEFAEVKSHPLKSESIIRLITFLKEALPVVRHHHEHYDGRGYPDGLSDEKIPIESRIIAVVDAFDAMTSDRPYRKAMSKEEAIDVLRKCSKTQFDPEIVEVFISLV